MKPAIRIFLSLIACLAASAVNAHTIRPAVVTINASEQGELSIEIRTNAEALLADIGPEHSDTNDSPNAIKYNELRLLPAAALTQTFGEFAPEFLSKLDLRADSRPVTLIYAEIDVPDVGDIELARDSVIYLRAKLPEQANELVWSWPVEYGSNVVRFNTSAAETTYSAWLKSGEISEPLLLSGAQRSGWETGWNYLIIGFEHILPLGLDHILFVLGIFLLSTRLKPLLLQVTAFTVAHTITLGLSIYGIISAPASIVEPLIALSIAYVGIENCLSKDLKPWRIVLVFLFGLLHGMGFAGVLQEIGLPRSEFVTALITFNIGVEFGQLAVIALAFLLVGWWRNQDWYRSRIVIPLSLAISVVGLYWTVERIAG